MMKTVLRSLGLGFVGLFIFAFTASADVAPGDQAPDFTLPDTHGAERTLSQSRGKYVVLEWTNPDCPFVRKHYDSGNMQGLQKDLTGEDVVWYSIASSGANLQGNYSAEKWNEILAQKDAAPTALLLDPEGTVGKQYGAKTTPHMFVINPEGVVIYAGAIDDRPSFDPNDIPAATNYVHKAIEEARAGSPVSVASSAPYGCSVKYAH